MPAKPSPRSRRATTVSVQTNGALSSTTTVSGDTANPASTTSNTTPSVASTIGRGGVNQAGAAINASHQTHGAVMQQTNPITSVGQLTHGGRSLNASTMAHYRTMDDYTRFLRGLSVAQLREHAALEAKLVPIDDNERLIKRLQTEWTSTQRIIPPAPRGFTAEQIAAQDEIRRKLLGR